MGEEEDYNKEVERLLSEATICPLCLLPGEEIAPVEQVDEGRVVYARCPLGHVYLLEQETEEDGSEDQER